ncbi:MAG: hypothetical protein DCF32_14500 [Leptolyngbya sp.]|nr:MAG: hypothetical protein DCF32_14500 [Leptolyngbya sp.]
MNQINLTLPWDMAGVDGLVAARALFGEAIDHLAPFQSMETELEGLPCAVLRLCDRNFRITYPGALDHIVRALQLQVWVKQLGWMGAIALPAEQFPAVAAQATVRSPHRLHGLPLHCAVPAQIAILPILLWYHPVADQPVLELHFAKAQSEDFYSLIRSFIDG